MCQLDERVRLVQADLGDGGDRADVVTTNAIAAQVNVTGGSGDDLIRGRGPSRLDFAGNEGDDLLIASPGNEQRTTRCPLAISRPHGLAPRGAFLAQAAIERV